MGRLGGADGMGRAGLPGVGAPNGEGSEFPGLTHRFRPFDKLTSVHVDTTDTMLLASGYSASVRIYDLETGKVGVVCLCVLCVCVLRFVLGPRLRPRDRQGWCYAAATSYYFLLLPITAYSNLVSSARVWTLY